MAHTAIWSVPLTKATHRALPPPATPPPPTSSREHWAPRGAYTTLSDLHVIAVEEIEPIARAVPMSWWFPIGALLGLILAMGLAAMHRRPTPASNTAIERAAVVSGGAQSKMLSRQAPQ